MTCNNDFHVLIGTLQEATRTGDTVQANREITRLMEMVDDYVDERVAMALQGKQCTGYTAPLYSRR